MDKTYKILAIIILCLACYNLHGQVVTISPSGGVTAVDIPEMLTMNLLSSASSDITGHIQFEVSSNGTVVVSGNTADITLLSQTNYSIDQINVDGIVLPLNLTYVEPSVATGINNGYILPDGNYNVCVDFIENGLPVSTQLCQLKTVGTINVGGTLHLISPLDESEPPTLTPLFSWVAIGNDILYEIKITEVLPHQVSVHGVSINNPAFHSEDNLNSFNYFYPITAPQIETCKYYEWRITAYENVTTTGDNGPVTTRNDLAVSEVYRFGSSCSNQVFRVSSLTFMTLNKSTNSYPYNIGGTSSSVVIPFKYIEKYAAKNVIVKIENLSQPSFGVVFNETLTVENGIVFGANYIESISLDDIGTDYYNPTDLLLLSVTNIRGETQYAKFKLQQD